MNDHIPDATKMISDTPRMQSALLDVSDAGFANIWQVGCEIERELHAANERIKRLEEAGDVAQSQGGQAVSVEERILFLAESPDCNHPRELRAIAFQVRKLEDRIKQLESENDALRADLLLWEEKEAKP